MFYNYLKIAFRNILRKKFHNFINIFGLATGIAFCILILLFVKHEFSYDSFQENKERIFRVDKIYYKNNQPDFSTKQTIHPLPLPQAIKNEIPEIEYSTAYMQWNRFVKYDEKLFREKVNYVSEDFTKIFTIDFIAGNKTNPIGELKNVIISQKIAKKYFNNSDPIGKELLINDEPFIVAAVFKNLPPNTSLNHEIIVRYENNPNYYTQKTDWNASYVPVFVQLHKHTSIHKIKKKADAFIDKYEGWETKAAIQREEIKETQKYIGLDFVALTDIHFDNSVSWFNVSNIQYSYILAFIAMLILILACINYILLSLTGSADRTREVGIRKVLGARNSTIRWQFWGEAQIITFIALFAGLTLAQLFLPTFNNFTDKKLEIALMQNADISAAILLITVITGLLAGGYPAIILSRFLPTRVLKDSNSQKYKSGFAKNIIGFQLVTCIAFIMAFLIMQNQLNFISNKDLGFNAEQVLQVSAWNKSGIRPEIILNRFRTTLANDPTIKGITASNNPFGAFGGSTGRTYKDQQIRIYNLGVDYDYFNLMEIDVVKGRNFNQTDLQRDSIEAIIINESLARRLSDDFNFDVNLGKPFLGNANSEVIGIVKDFNFYSLEFPIMPMQFSMDEEYDYIYVKVAAGQVSQALKKLENLWKESIPSEEFNYSFVDDNIAEQYDNYKQWMKIIAYAASFGILISCLGLFGLTGITITNRTKEIGIRKVLGASVHQILLLLNRQILIIFCIAVIVAIPLAYFAMNRWLENFEYRISISPNIVSISVLATILLITITVSFYSLKAAFSNPSDALRNE